MHNGTHHGIDMQLIINFGDRQQITVSSIAEARDLFENVRDDGNFGDGFGARDMEADCGHLLDDSGRQFGRISYNGRVCDMDGNELA